MQRSLSNCHMTCQLLPCQQSVAQYPTLNVTDASKGAGTYGHKQRDTRIRCCNLIVPRTAEWIADTSCALNERVQPTDA